MTNTEVRIEELTLANLHTALNILDSEGSVTLVRPAGAYGIPLNETMHHLELLIIAAHEARVRKAAR